MPMFRSWIPSLAALLLPLLLASPSAAQIEQTGPKIAPNTLSLTAQFGSSVAISSDGNTAIFGAPFQNPVGAAFVYERSGTAWSPQGTKLVGLGATTIPEIGYSVALSANGNTAATGAPGDNASAGAVWVFTRSAGA